MNSPAYGYPGVYTVQKVAPAGEAVRLHLNMPLVVTHWVIGKGDAAPR